jgi:aryl-alcohol dehydrogenase-like predicted oxidoreductase
MSALAHPKASDTARPAGLPRRRVGRTGLSLSCLGVGGWLGSLDAPRARQEAAAVEAVQRAVSLGVNYFDTAPMYGEAERYLGLGLSALAPEVRATIAISTKVGWHPERKHQYDADSVHWSLDRSLRLLGSDRVDIVHVHYPLSDAHLDQMLGAGGAVEALEDLKAQGVVGAISLGSRPHRFLSRAIQSGRFDIVMTVYDYNPLRASAAPIVALAAEHNVGLFNASPYNAGLLAGVDPDLAAARRAPDLAGDLERARALWRWSQARGVDLGALAVQFSLRDERVAVTLTGPRDAAEVEANIRHALAPLPDGIWEELDTFIMTLGAWTPGGEAGVLA